MVPRTFGWKGTVRRLRHEIWKRRDAYLERPTLHTNELGTPHLFLAPNAARLSETVDRAAAIALADRVLGGEYHAFSGEWRRLPSRPEEWLVDPVTGNPAPGTDRPWWKIETLPDWGDIKNLWEPARFAWVYDLVRGHALTGNPDYRTFFFDMLESWVAANPPFLGPHWACGQETSIRALALLVGEAHFQPETTAERELLRDVFMWSGERVADAIGYGLSQRNNHGISEATGLVTLGSRLMEATPAAEKWFERGRTLLGELIDEQFETDGWYIQQSTNYLRLALHQCVVADLTLKARGKALSQSSRSRLKASARLLTELIVPANGRAPNYGSNDGARVLPISLAPYHDYRAVITMVCSVFEEPYPANLETDLESLAWLSLEAPLAGPDISEGVNSGKSGWASGRIGRYQFFIRAARYRTRPGQTDPLNLELWIDGMPVIVDPGSYSYNSPSPWRGFGTHRAHNGPRVEGYQASMKGPRFLSLKWPQSRIVQCQFRNGEVLVVAEIPQAARRTVTLSTSGCVVEDRSLPADRPIAVNWLLYPDAQPEMTFDGAAARAGDATQQDVLGWYSPTYGLRLRSQFVDLSATGTTNEPITSRFKAGVTL